MAKRFTATEKWLDPWFCGLNLADKLFWIYLLDTCDHAGIWQVNWPLVRFYLPGYEYLPERFEHRIVTLNPQKWFLPKFVAFQYGDLNPTNRLHLSVLNMLEKEGLTKGLARTYLGPKDNNKDKNKDRDRETERGGLGEKTKGFDFAGIWKLYPNKDGRRDAERHFKATVKTEKDWQDIHTALRHYLQSKKVKEGFIKNGSTWFNNWQDWIDYTGDDHASNGSTGISEYTALAQRAREAQGLRKATSAGEVLAGVRNLPAAEPQTKTSGGAGQ